MVDALTIGGALSSLKTASDIARTLIGLRDDTQMRSKVIDLQSAIIAAQSSALEAQSEQNSLLQRECDLQAEITGLRRELTALRHAPAIPEGRMCPKCGGEMRVTDEQAHPVFGMAGTKVHALECQQCHTKTTRDFQPGSGYC